MLVSEVLFVETGDMADSQHYDFSGFWNST